MDTQPAILIGQFRLSKATKITKQLVYFLVFKWLLFLYFAVVGNCPCQLSALITWNREVFALGSQ